MSGNEEKLLNFSPYLFLIISKVYWISEKGNKTSLIYYKSIGFLEMKGSIKSDEELEAVGKLKEKMEEKIEREN